MANHKHGAPCTECGRRTYKAGGICRFCAPQKVEIGRPPDLVPPRFAPEDYLIACVDELVRRHKVRAETLAKIGIAA